MNRLSIQGRLRVIQPNSKNGVSVLIADLNLCSNLKYIFKEESNMDHLVYLEVIDCYYLTKLVSSSTSFRNLATLWLTGCNKLTNILTSSTAKSLVQLRKLSVGDCRMLTEVVVADEGDDAKDNEIVFSKLKELRLNHLKNITSFCSANYTLIFPSLEDLTMEFFPKMKTFCGGNLSTPKLQKVTPPFRSNYQWPWKGDLDTTIRELHKDGMY